jgi:hypothetical protein
VQLPDEVGRKLRFDPWTSCLATLSAVKEFLATKLSAT